MLSMRELQSKILRRQLDRYAHSQRKEIDGQIYHDSPSDTEDIFHFTMQDKKYRCKFIVYEELNRMGRVSGNGTVILEKEARKGLTRRDEKKFKNLDDLQEIINQFFVDDEHTNTTHEKHFAPYLVDDKLANCIQTLHDRVLLLEKHFTSA